MTIVLDASVVAKWFVEEPQRAEARRLRHYARLAAPDWLLQEIAHVAFKKWRDHEIGAEQAKTMVQSLPSLIDRLYPSRELTVRTLDIALRLKHPVYDCLYIACAEAAGGVLITADNMLCAAVRGTPFERLVRHLTNVDLSEQTKS